MWSVPSTGASAAREGGRDLQRHKLVCRSLVAGALPFEVAFQHSTRRLHGLEAPMHSVALSDDGLEVLLRASNA